MQQHIGSPEEVIASVGDKIKCGQVIGVCDDDTLGAKIHTSIDGNIAEIADRIVIEK